MHVINVGLVVENNNEFGTDLLVNEKGKQNLMELGSCFESVCQWVSTSICFTVAEVYLCIMEAPHLKDKLGDRIRGIIANQYNTPESSVAFWSGRGQNMISAEHMIYFLKDVAQYV